MLLYVELSHMEVLASNTLQHFTHITATRQLCETFQYQAIACKHTYANTGVQMQAQILNCSHIYLLRKLP